METVLVTGGNGFIGSNLVRRIVELGEWQVRVLVLQGTPEEFLDPVRDQIEIVYGDITRPETLPPAVKGVSIIFHLAALVTDWGPKAKFLNVIYEGTKNVVDAAIAAGVRRFVQMSSLAVHGYMQYRNEDETTPRHNSKFYYGQAKNLAEDYLGEVYQAGKIETVVVRPAWTIYGENDYATIYQVLENIKLGRFGYISSGKALCTHIYVQNLVDGIIHVGRHPDAPGETFIISDATKSWREFTELLAAGIGAQPPTLSTPYSVIAPIVWLWGLLWRLFRVKKSPLLTMYRIGIQRYDLDFSGAKITEKFGFQPRFTFEEGLQRTLDWYNSVSTTPVKHPTKIK